MQSAEKRHYHLSTLLMGENDLEDARGKVDMLEESCRGIGADALLLELAGKMEGAGRVVRGGAATRAGGGGGALPGAGGTGGGS